MVIDERYYMSLALREAWKYQGATYPNPAVGALILDSNGRIVSLEAHRKAGLPHAEVEALKSAFLKLNTDSVLNNRLSGLEDSTQIHQFLEENHNFMFTQCTMYVTLEPCAHYGKTPPCASLLSVLGIKKVFIGSTDFSDEAGGGEKILKSANVEVHTGVLKEECDVLLEPFRLWSRKNFIFFKHAQSINGTIDGGYLSSDKTLDFVHELRDKIDLIVVGGSTVRTDRPVLDARRVGGRAPDVLIYSKQKDFDMDIPLFKVKGRNVHISDTLDMLNSYRFVMIEGGGSMFEAVKDIADWHLLLIADKHKTGLGFKAQCEEKILHIEPTGSDMKVWSKIIK